MFGERESLIVEECMLFEIATIQYLRCEIMRSCKHTPGHAKADMPIRLRTRIPIPEVFA